MFYFLSPFKRILLVIGLNAGLSLLSGGRQGLFAQSRFSLTMMAGVSMDMPKEAVEKLAGKKIKAENDFTPVRVILEGETYNIIFHTFSDSSKHVYRISTRSHKLRSNQGIGVGSHFTALWKTYKEQKYFTMVSKAFYERSERDQQGDYAFRVFTPRQPKDGYFHEYVFYLDGKTDRVLEMALYHSEDP